MKKKSSHRIIQPETLLKLKAVLKNVVKKKRDQNSIKDFSIAVKLRTAQVDYGKDGGSRPILSSSLVLSGR
jgi:cell division protein FtsI/penicillin-binding protein 2